jgi:hypothetical protein
MDTFVVRVYRSEPGHEFDTDRLRGVVDEIATGLQATFHDAGELLSILQGREREEHPKPSPTQGGANEPLQDQTQ